MRINWDSVLIEVIGAIIGAGIIALIGYIFARRTAKRLLSILGRWIISNWRLVLGLLLLFLMGLLLWFLKGQVQKLREMVTEAHATETVQAEEVAAAYVTQTLQAEEVAAAYVAQTLQAGRIATLESTAQTDTSECQTDYADSIFKQVLIDDQELAQALGHRRLPQPLRVWTSYQAFDEGFMIWRADSVDIYVLTTNESFWVFEDHYTDGMPQPSCDSEPPEGRIRPVRGFGKVWCDNPQVKEELGFATGQEVNRELPLQTFEGGWLIIIDNAVYALISSDDRASGNWRRIELGDHQMLSIEELPRSERSSQERNCGRPPAAPDTLSGIPFDTRWGVSTRCSDGRDHHPLILSWEGIEVSNPVSVYLLLQAGYGFRQYEGTQIGEVRLHFSGGKSYDVPVILGFNVRDWRRDNPEEAVITVTSSDVQPAWEGIAPSGAECGVDILTIDLPSSYWQSTLTSVEISDESASTTGDLDPCIQLLAVTVRYLR